MDWGNIISALIGTFGGIGVYQIGKYLVKKFATFDVNTAELADHINQVFKQELENHVRYCNNGCDPQDNLCSIGEEIVARWKTALQQLVEEY